MQLATEFSLQDGINGISHEGDHLKMCSKTIGI
jgi:hypothetical protein